MTLYSEAQKMDIAKFIHFLVEDKLPYNKDNTNKILVINLQLSVTDYSGNSKEKKCFPSLVFYRPGSYVTTAVIEREIMSNDIDPEQEAIFLGCHDSCWRGHVEDYFRKLAKRLTEDMPEDASVFNTFSIFKSVEILEGRVTKDEKKRTAKIITNEAVVKNYLNLSEHERSVVRAHFKLIDPTDLSLFEQSKQFLIKIRELNKVSELVDFINTMNTPN